MGCARLSDDGWRLVRQGVTTPEEVMRVTKDQSLGNGPKEDAKAGRQLRHNLDRKMPWPCFSIKRFRPTARLPKARLKPAAGRRPSGRWRSAGSPDQPGGERRPVQSGKSSRRGCPARQLRELSLLNRTRSRPGCSRISRGCSPVCWRRACRSAARLVILCKEAATPAAGAKWKEVHDSVIDGMSLADAMAKSPETFPRVYVAMVEAGETGGFLDVVLAQIADFQAREKEMRSKVMTALALSDHSAGAGAGRAGVPAGVFHSAVSNDFDGFGAKLPLLTQIIIGTSQAMRHYGLFIAVGLVVGVFWSGRWVVSEKGRRAWEGLILRAAGHWSVGRRNLRCRVFAGCLEPCSAPACLGARLERGAANPSATRFSWMRFPTPSSA